jgi:hypothetical protein
MDPCGGYGMRRRTPAVNHCLRRAAEAEQLAELADDAPRSSATASLPALGDGLPATLRAQAGSSKLPDLIY